jgi:hypothetical protein
MKTRSLLIILIIISACSQNSGTNNTGNSADLKIRKQVTVVTEKYITGQLPDSEKTISKNGVITLGNGQKRYIINPAKVFTGLIDDDQSFDALVSLEVFQGQDQVISEQLIILASDDKMMLASAIESDMRIISLKDRVITADVPEHSRNTPLFNCRSCWEVVKFKFKMGELVRIE